MTTTRPSRPEPAAPKPAAAPRGVTAFVRLRRIFAAETPEYSLLLGTTLFLVVFGLVMVLSSSSIESRASDGDFFARAARQAMLAGVGVPLMLIVSRAPVGFWKRWAWQAMIAAIVLQFLVVATNLGFGSYNRNWLYLGSFSFQPSEAVKLALIVWLALIVSTKARLMGDWKHVAMPILPFAGGAIFLVLVGNDLGTAIILFAMVLGALFFGGVRMRIIAALVGLITIAALILVQLSDSRSGRFSAWLGGCSDPSLAGDECYQTLHGWQALANGGFFGVGLGNSASKWNWLPEAETDFIFAIIGEELGLVGAVLVVLLFAVLAVCFVRIMRRQTDPFVKLATGVAMVWIIGQAFVNIAVVLGLLPVLGVPLPLVSAGGSSLVTTLVAIGIVLSFARTDPRATELAR
ncbi:putative lipid II flippase FtsW [Protaetiibacter intestinalis]|uniref:Probable peptidoglycan glycosyltransferase FtsW n=1 Tax=Protaetiibacter intestinalis TaxID=2419774 RepID=A0A387BDT1_9MICO|nr:putative lipid II flippase FtsW [Protaetiibacter intestinalis]AYF99206.1 putative lipid II flippase FtsW [Protaetiibacter intestinalis]